MVRARAGPVPRACRRDVHILVTANLRLHTPTRRDRAIMQAAGSDPEAQRWLGWTAGALVPEPLRDRLLAMEPGRGPRQPIDPDHWLAAVDRASGLVAGAACLGAGSLEVGGWLAPGFRGRGLGAELFAAIAQFGHHHLGITTVRAGAEPANMACVAALLAAGFEPAQGPQTHHLPDGRIVPSRWFRHNTGQPARCRGRRSRPQAG